ncbi:MAG: ATP-binding protein [Bacillota bacterium]|nr:ATP-binding protein [Bacillota bacterium]
MAQDTMKTYHDLSEATELAWATYCLLLLSCALSTLGSFVDQKIWLWSPPTVDLGMWGLSVAGWTIPLGVVTALCLISRSRLITFKLTGVEHLLLAAVVIGSTLVAVFTEQSALLSIVPVFLLALSYGKRAGIAVALFISALLGFKKYAVGDVQNLEAFLASAIVLIAMAYLVGGMVEITRQALARSRREADNLQRLVDNIPLGVCVLNEKGERVYANPLVGDIETRLIEARLSPAVVGKAGGVGLDEFDEIEFEGEKFRVHFSRYLTPDGESSIAIVENISEYLRLKEEVRRASYLAAVGEMAAGVAHEIRNPLAAISGYLQLVLEQKDGTKVRDVRRYLETALEEIGLLAKITQDFLELARPQEIKKVPVNLNDIVEGMRGVLENEALHLEVRLSINPAPDLPEVGADPGSVKQVILNLVSNAYQAVGKGGRVEIKTYQGPQDIFLEVRDNGPGIPKGLREKVFVPFFTTKDSGTGIGLSISKRIALDHGGDIYCSSQPGETRFIMRIPRGDRPLGRARKPEEVERSNVLPVAAGI